MNKQQKWNVWHIILLVVCIVMFVWGLCILYGCGAKVPGKGSTLTGDIIKENKTIKDPKVACLQDAIKKQTIFKHTFKYDDSYPPTLYVYITGEWNQLGDEGRESTLTAIGESWHECNPSNMTVLTVMAYDDNNIPLLAVFVSKGD